MTQSSPSLCCARLFSSLEPRGASCFLQKSNNKTGIILTWAERKTILDCFMDCNKQLITRCTAESGVRLSFGWSLSTLPVVTSSHKAALSQRSSSSDAVAVDCGNVTTAQQHTQILQEEIHINSVQWGHNGFYVWIMTTCGCGLAQQCVRSLHCGYHGASGGICNGGRIVGVLCLGAAVALQRLRL